MVAFSFAQEMDTTYVINQNGETIGIIHEKGTVPVIPAVQQPQASVANPSPYAFMSDSTEYYQSMVDLYTNKGNSMRRTGKAMMLGGGLGAALCLGLFFTGIVSSDSDDGVVLMTVGYYGMLGGAAVFTAGTVVKIVGGAKLRKGQRYEQKLMMYNIRRNMVQLQFTPNVDLNKGSVGGNFALNF